MLLAGLLLQLAHLCFQGLNFAIQLLHGRFLDKDRLRHVISGTRLLAEVLRNPLFCGRIAGGTLAFGLFQTVKKPVNKTLLFRLHGSYLCHDEVLKRVWIKFSVGETP